MSPTTSSPPVSLSGMVAALSIADANASIPMLGSGEGMEECSSHDNPSGYSSVNNSSNSSKNSNTSYVDNSRPMFLTPNFHSEGSSVTSESSYLGSRRSSKDSCESTPGTQVDDLVDQMIVPDYANPQDQTDQIERTKVFLMIYRRFMRPRELLEKLIDRFEALGESLDEDTHANETRLRICFCLYYWLKNHPNDILHRQTRQLVAAFLRDRVALFPCLNDIYVELLPLSSIHYFNTWRFPQPENSGSASIDAGSSQGSSRSRSHSSSSVTVTFADSFSLSATAPTTASTSASSSIVSDSDSDSGSLDTNSISAYPEEDLDEDREWGLADEDEIVTESPAASMPSSSDYNKKSSFYLADGLAPFAHLVSAFNGGNSGNGSSSSARNSVLGFHSKATFPAHHQLPPRDRRSSTGSFATQTLSPCAMETFVAGRRGSASSISSNPGPFTSTTLGFAEGDLTPMQQLQLQLQPIGEIPFINKRSSSQAYRQHRAYSHSQLGSAAPVYHSVATLAPVPVVGTATSAPVTTVNSGSSTPVSSSKLHPAQSPSPAPSSHNHHYPDHLSGAAGVVAKAALIFKEAMEEKVHPLSHQHHQQQHGGKSSHHQQHHHYAGGLLASLSPPMDHLSSSSPLNIPFMEIKDKAIAEQLTCVEYGLFKKLKPRDMLRQVWKTKKGSAAFQACIAHFNFISSWVGTMILLPPKAKHRARMMEKFISIAKILRDMGNYNTTMAIIGAMNTSSIHRLVQTRELLQSKEIWNTFKELEQLMSSLRSFSEYRAALRTHTTQGGGPSSNQPCIPYLGVHLADLLSISEGNKDFRQDGALHWQKFVLMTDVISMVLSFQQEPGYRIKPDPFISKVITDTHVLDDEEMYTKSVGTEPNKLNHSRSLSKFNFF
ncbi:hypothetical protein BGZ75_006563 [Mortierella antarctica]|nr:hypothetical protein BGZ75_006563 [Mortierella antarctica]